MPRKEKKKKGNWFECHRWKSYIFYFTTWTMTNQKNDEYENGQRCQQNERKRNYYSFFFFFSFFLVFENTSIWLIIAWFFMGIEKLNGFYWEKWHSMPFHTAYSAQWYNIPISLYSFKSLVCKDRPTAAAATTQIDSTIKYFWFGQRAFAIWQPLFLLHLHRSRDSVWV